MQYALPNQIPSPPAYTVRSCGAVEPTYAAGRRAGGQDYPCRRFPNNLLGRSASVPSSVQVLCMDVYQQFDVSAVGQCCGPGLVDSEVLSLQITRFQQPQQ